MLTIHKYKLDCGISQQVTTRKFATFLSVIAMGCNVYLYAEVEDEAGEEVRTVEVVGTGRLLPYNAPLRFIGSAVLLDSTVWHVYEHKMPL
jgi:hypothetical protein